MKKFRVQIEGATATPVLMKTVHDVDRYAAQMNSRGGRTVLVGDETGDLRPYEEWRKTRLEPRASTGR